MVAENTSEQPPNPPFVATPHPDMRRLAGGTGGAPRGFFTLVGAMTGTSGISRFTPKLGGEVIV